jgi:hypothetical protein
VEQEVARAAEAPEDLSRVLERRKLDAVFRLWADRRGEGGRVERKDLCKALTRCPAGLPETLTHARSQGKARAAAQCARTSARRRQGGSQPV